MVRERLQVHHVGQSHHLGYLRVGVDWRLGVRTAGAQVSVAYLMTTRVGDGQLDPAIGGLDIAVGPYLRF